jgi:hypothetical protein
MITTMRRSQARGPGHLHLVGHSCLYRNGIQHDSEAQKVDEKSQDLALEPRQTYVQILVQALSSWVPTKKLQAHSQPLLPHLQTGANTTVSNDCPFLHSK